MAIEAGEVIRERILPDANWPSSLLRSDWRQQKCRGAKRGGNFQPPAVAKMLWRGKQMKHRLNTDF